MLQPTYPSGVTLPASVPNWENLANILKALRVNLLETIATAKTGHLGACTSSLELLGVLYFGNVLRYDSANPAHPDRDQVLIRGHVGPLRYNIFHLLGWLSQEEMAHYRRFGSRLAGHEDMFLTPGVDVSPSGSLGMLLSYAVGLRLGYQNQQKDNRVFCFLGDGEEQEGNISEAARHGAHLGLENLICVIDKNGKQLSATTQETDRGADLETLWRGYGWRVITLSQGHNPQAIFAAYAQAIQLAATGPVCIIADTVKGNGIPGAVDHYSGYHVYHGKDSGSGDVHNDKASLRTGIDLAPLIDDLKSEGSQPYRVPVFHLPLAVSPSRQNRFVPIEPVFQSTQRTSYDYLYDYLISISQQTNQQTIYVLTADYPPRSLVYEGNGFAFPHLRYYNLGLREQHLFAMVHGLHLADPAAKIIILCGDAFLYRSADQLNALAQGKTPVVIYAVESGMCGAKNGPTHQSAGQSGMVGCMPGVAWFEPASQADFYWAMNQALASPDHPTYLRTDRGRTPAAYRNQIGRWYVAFEPTETPQGTIIASGMLVEQAIQAAHQLAASGSPVRVINLVAPKDCHGVGQACLPAKPVFIYYNGDPTFVAGQIAIDCLRLGIAGPSDLIARGFQLGTTGTIEELMDHLGLSTAKMVEQIRAYPYLG